MMPFRYQRFRKKFILFLLIFSLVPLPENCSLASGAQCNGDSDWSHQMTSTYLCTPWCIVHMIFFIFIVVATIFVMVHVTCNGIFIFCTIVVQLAVHNSQQRRTSG